MLNRFYLLSALFIAIPLLLILSSKIPLTFFILYPLMLFPYFYPAQNRRTRLDHLLLGIAIALLVYFLIRHFSLESFILAVFQAAMTAALLFYRAQWSRQLKDAVDQKNMVLKDLESFNKKFESRVTSLKHLERQVTGLLDLFEISKEFSEYLSFQGITDILLKRVKPLFPFQQLVVLLVYLKPEAPEKMLRYEIDHAGIRLRNDPLSAEEQEALEKLKMARSVIHRETEWVFPLLFDDVLQSCLRVQGGLADDLAKFEVLSAFLTLQVSKIRLYNSVRELAIRDSLTHVFVRRHFLERFEEELKRSIKFSMPLAVLMLDIDHFKRYNDEYGHIAGDATLTQVADLLHQSLRKVDIVGRYGGEEFVVAIPETREEGALEISERIRSNVARYVFKIYNTEARVTVSIGMALFSPESVDKEREYDVSKIAFELIQRADKALYQAKEEGRNQVVLYRGS